MSFFASDVVTIHVSQLLDELGPVLASHLDHGGIETVMFHLEITAVCSCFESLAKVVSCCLRISIWPDYCNDKVSFLLQIFD